MLCVKHHLCLDKEKFSCQDQGKMPSFPSCIYISSEHDIFIARRHILERLKMLNIEQLESHYIATAVSELANNLFFHTQNGGILQFFHLMKNYQDGIEIIAFDDGPGIDDLEQAVEDGYSTNGGLGAGLGGVKRLMDEFKIKSECGRGTHIVARKWMTKSAS